MDKPATFSSIEPRRPITTETKYYTIKGKQDFLDEDGYPCQNQENKYTYAKCTGQRRLVKLDRQAELYDPNGMFTKLPDDDRWLQVDEPCFKQYILFLCTGNNLYYTQARRNVR